MSVKVSELAATIGGSVITPAEAGYAEIIHRWAANAEKEAAVVVLASSSADVAAAVLCLQIISNSSLHTQKKRGWKLRLAEVDTRFPVHHQLTVVSSLISVK